MFQNGKTFEAALEDAQKLGYAERNPAADVEGHDACRKIAILSSLAWGKFVDYKNIYTEGITGITQQDVAYAEKMDSVIKLIGYAECDENNKICAMVRPMMVKNTSPVSGVSDVFNAILVTGDSLGDAMFYGRGAGKLATASAVVADVIDCVKCKENKKNTSYWKESDAEFMNCVCDNKARFFVRVDKNDAVQNEFKNVQILSNDKETVFVTDEINESELKNKLEKIGKTKTVIRILEA